MKQLNIVKNFKIYAIISVILVAAGLAALVSAPFGVNMFNLDIDFAGGCLAGTDACVQIVHANLAVETSSG